MNQIKKRVYTIKYKPTFKMALNYKIYFFMIRIFISSNFLSDKRDVAPNNKSSLVPVFWESHQLAKSTNLQPTALLSCSLYVFKKKKFLYHFLNLN